MQNKTIKKTPNKYNPYIDCQRVVKKRVQSKMIEASTDIKARIMTQKERLEEGYQVVHEMGNQYNSRPKFPEHLIYELYDLAFTLLRDKDLARNLTIGVLEDIIEHYPISLLD